MFQIISELSHFRSLVSLERLVLPGGYLLVASLVLLTLD